MHDNYAKINNICLIILTAIGLTMALIYTKAIMVPFVFAVFLSAVAAPAVRWFRTKLKFPSVLAVGAVFTVVLIVLGSLIFLIVNSLNDFFASAGTYETKIKQFIDWAGQQLKSLGVEYDEHTIPNALKQLPVSNFTGLVQSLTGSAVSLLGNAALVIVFVFFLIIGQGAQKSQNPLLAEIFGKISRYISIKFVISLVTGVLAGLILAAFNVELAFMFGILTFLLNFIPNIGSLIATALPLPILLLQFQLGWQTFVILGILMIIQLIIGNLLEPKFMGESMDLHPVTILIFLVFWGIVWGLAGMFLAVPITAIMKIILSRIENTKEFAELLGGRLPT